MPDTMGASALALSAFARGWLSPELLWQIAEQWASGSYRSLEELFSLYLSTDQLAALFPQQTIVSARTPELAQTMNTKAPSFSQRDRAASSSGTSRYTLGKTLGVGGSGQVFSALDTRIQRRVALKVLKQSRDNESAEVQNRFLKEASITAQLEHPCVIPIYDLDSLPDGRSFYTMRVVKSHSLREVLEERREILSSLPRLCTLLIQVCQALAYAHSRGVVHRDLKPENILLGDYGEVYLADWGICKLIDEGESPVVAPFFSEGEGSDNDSLQGAIAGTPGYMAPEQALGQEVDTRADLFAVGVILYEVLTKDLPFKGDNAMARMVSSVQKTPTAPRLIFKDCPLVLEALCLSLLQKSPNDRPESASVVAAELESFLAGVKERQQRRAQAEQLIERAAEPIERFLVADEEREGLLGRARSLLQSVPAYEPIEKKRPAWALEDLASAKEREQATAAADAVLLLSQALDYDPTHAAARARLSDIYWRLARQAEHRRDESARLLHEAKVLEYDDGRYAAILRSEAWLSLQSSHPAEVLAFRYYEHDRILTCGEAVPLGHTPLREVRLSPGRYLLILRRRGFRDTRYPLMLNRGEHHQSHVNLYTEEQLGPELVYIPAGKFLMGGDTEAFDSLHRQELHLDDYAIGRFPITFGQYLEFIQHLPEEEALRRIPYDLIDNPPLVERASNGRWAPRYDILIEGDGQRFCSREQVSQLPVFAISWFDAVAYCRWRSTRDQCVYRLPTEAEWEKSARGPDGRFFPWGDRFDALFCKMRDARRGVPQPEPIGAFPLDESPYGVRDLAGGVRDLCADVFGSIDWESASLEEESAGTSRVSRGGAWNTPALRCRSAARFVNQAGNRYVNGGFRLVKILT